MGLPYKEVVGARTLLPTSHMGYQIESSITWFILVNFKTEKIFALYLKIFFLLVFCSSGWL